MSGLEVEKSSAAREDKVGRETGTQALSLLQMEYLRTCGEVERSLGQNEKGVQYALAIISGIVYLSVKDKIYGVLGLVPLFCSGVFLYIINIHEFAMISRGYLAYLERRINETLGADVLLWETQHAKKNNHFLGSTIFVAAIAVVYGILVSSYSLYTFYSYFDRAVFGKQRSEVFFWAYSALCLIPPAFGLYKISNLGKLRDKVFKQCSGGKGPP